MNYGQTAIGEVRVIANYLGINPWEFESPFVLRKNKIYEVICMYLTLEIRYSLQTHRFVEVRISLSLITNIIKIYRTKYNTCLLYTSPSPRD